MDKMRFLDQLAVMSEELRRRGQRRWPKEIQQSCVEMLLSGYVTGPELSETMGVSCQTVYLWKKRFPRGGFKELRLIHRGRTHGHNSWLNPIVKVNGFEVQLGELSVSELKSILEGLR